VLLLGVFLLRQPSSFEVRPSLFDYAKHLGTLYALVSFDLRELALTVPVALVLMLIAQLLGASSGVLAVLPPNEARLVDNWRVGIHVALIAFANAGFAIAATASLMYILLERQLKRKKGSKLLSRLPSLAQTDTVARRSVMWSFPLYTAALLLGVLRAIETDVQGWWADPRVMLAGVVWLLFALYLFMRWNKGWKGRSAAYLCLFAFVVVAVLAVVARTVPAGFHVFAV
jgi:ABC-type transport system involved in cytochrome c biogenesis permease subunit